MLKHGVVQDAGTRAWVQLLLLFAGDAQGDKACTETSLLRHCGQGGEMATGQAGSRKSSMQRWTIPELTQIGQLHHFMGLSQTPLMAGCLSHVSITSSFGADPGIFGGKKTGGRDSHCTVRPSQTASTPLSPCTLQVGITPWVLPSTAPHKPGEQDAVGVKVTQAKRGFAPRSRMPQAQVLKISSDAWGGSTSMHQPLAARREQRTGQPTRASLP